MYIVIEFSTVEATARFAEACERRFGVRVEFPRKEDGGHLFFYSENSETIEAVSNVLAEEMQPGDVKKSELG